MQVKLQVELKWRRGYSGSASSNPLSWLRGGFQRVFSSQSTQSQFSIMNSSRVLAQMNSTDVSDEIFLPVEASVRVWVDGNIPLKGNTARKIARTPLSRIVPLVGSIATSTAMKALAPTLGDLLVSDYLGRRKSLGQKLEPEPSPNTYNEST